MKRSNIILLLSLAITILQLIFPSAVGFVSMDKEGKPADFMSKFWMDMYPDRISYTAGHTINHIQIVGNKDATISLEIKKGPKQDLNSHDFQNFTYELEKDTLKIRLKKGNTYLHLEQPSAIQSISCTDQTDLKLIPIQPNDSIQQLSIILQDASRLKMGEYTKTFKNGSQTGSEGWVSIKNLQLNLFNKSVADLATLRSDQCIANLNDSYLSCERLSYIDSLQIQLSGKSTIKNTPFDIIPQDPENIIESSATANIKHLIVSGDMSYFNKRFIHPNTQITIR